ncbi:MAG: aldehyde:ferredoxin oxidoreductase [Thermoplasmata archaeon]|nr:MAG: aldehyde:ferredoxin oxidoreductase [Thermoplasmatales archaeon ex4484_6]RLF53500.1 MAG: aldehyde:ferredoxin oxidoreductase [Thermoplasmata archaeon]HHD16447.1 4Fe-4S dicluster domain-containing protein [Euryarchaeota archaeon]
MVETVKIIRFHAEKCRGHYDCEKACSQVQFGDDTGGDHSAIRIVKSNGGFSMVNCDQCGLCIDVCPVQALKRLPSGVVTVNKELCIGCMSCVAFCPVDGMRRAKGMVYPHKCISCGACVRACPEGALELVEVPISEVERVVYYHQGVCD